MNASRYILLALKGCAMGMADVVPGVSGGTIAFISGIYEELLDSIRSVDATALKLLLKGRFADFWRHINGNFLLSVLAGIAIAIFSLARLMTYLLTNHPIAIWSFFFGLIIASAVLVARQVGHWNWKTLLSFAVGAAVAWWITIATPAETPNDWWFVMLSGAIAICAMILPGISGAFILLLLGKYQYIMQAVVDLNIPVMAIFVVGVAIGIISFSHLRRQPRKGPAAGREQHPAGNLRDTLRQTGPAGRSRNPLRGGIPDHLRHRNPGPFYRIPEKRELNDEKVRIDRPSAGPFGLGVLLHGEVFERGDKRLCLCTL